MDVGYQLPWWFVYAFVGALSCYIILFTCVVYIRPWAYKRWTPQELGVEGVVPGQITDDQLEKAEKKSLKEAKRLARLLREQEKALKKLAKRQGGIERERERLLKKNDVTRTNRHHGKGGRIEARGERERQRKKRERQRQREEQRGEFRHQKINTRGMRAPQSGV